MPIAYHIYALERFPQNSSFETEEQLNLFVDDEQNMETSVTKVSLAAANFVEGFDKYDVLHEFLVRLKYPGRARGKTFSEYISPYRFPCYVERDSSNQAKFFFIQTKGQVAKDFVNRLNKRYKAFEAQSLTIDLDAVRPTLQVITGAWFRDMRAANISSTGVFGPHVDRSNEFLNAESIGKLGALIISFPLDEVTYTTMITEEAGVILYDNFDEEKEALSIVAKIKSTLLDPFILAKSKTKKAV